jgi:5-methyltetrahydrofolate--homocysteine methyltransferase
MHAVTVGEVATEYAQKLFAGDDYTNYLYFHGMAVQTAEAMAEWLHARIRKELGFAEEDSDNIKDLLRQRYRGSRYSFGYPACPNMQDQYKQLDLLKTDRINMYMDDSEQLYPEQSTTAIITYHPVAKYFSA